MILIYSERTHALSYGSNMAQLQRSAAERSYPSTLMFFLSHGILVSFSKIYEQIERSNHGIYTHGTLLSFAEISKQKFLAVCIGMAWTSLIVRDNTCPAFGRIMDIFINYYSNDFLLV